MDKFKSGEVVNTSGSYGMVDKNGVEFIGICINLKEGDIFPPTEKDDYEYFIFN
ncbi:MAG: hypothetical protein LBU60_01835 [Clostridiales bacterium]|jgi:hypothetical protein|nr:hypothetical protein [Clostridiales bacterium]